MAKKRKKRNNNNKTITTKIKPQENNQRSSGVNFPAQECTLTLDHLSASADSTAQDHTEDHAKDHHHGDPNAHSADDVELVVEDLFDGLRAGLHCDACEYILFGADVRDELFHSPYYTTAIQRIVDGFQRFPLELVLVFQLEVGVRVKFLEFLNHLIFVRISPDGRSYFKGKYHQEEHKKQSQHALGLLHSPTAAQETHQHHEGAGSNQNINSCVEARMTIFLLEDALRLRVESEP